MTKIYFTTQAHNYTECADLENCTKRGHWYPEGDEEYDSYQDAMDAATLDDSEYVRIFENTVRVERKVAGGRA
jgi:hypothetical protein